MSNNLEKKPSWLPIALAVGIPLLLIVFVILFAPGPRQPPAPVPGTGEVREALEQAYIAITLETPGGEAVAGRAVVFSHRYTVPEYMGEYSEREYQRTTDSAGIATVTVPKTGDVTVRVEGSDTERRLLALERNAEASINLELVLDE